jgi:signal transduction histidine kinase
LLVSALVLALLGIGAAISLMGMTTALRRGTETLAEAVESVRATEELEVSLLRHDQARRLLDATSEPQHASDMEKAAQDASQALEQAEQHITTEQERGLVGEVRQATQAYLAAAGRDSQVEAGRRGELLQVAVDKSEALVTMNVEQARAMRFAADRVNSTSNVIGIIVSLLLLMGISTVLVVVRAGVYRPLLSLREALSAFKGGRRDSRLIGVGPAEFRELSEEFNEMADALTRQEKTQLQFLAGVAHDLRNPLSALKLSVNLLTRGATLPPEEKVRQTLTRIVNQVEHLNRMVDDLLDRTRIESGHLELRLEACELRGLVSEVVELHRPASPRHEFELALPSQPLPIRCDATRLGQVLTNLVSNAVKYSPEGGRIRIRLDQEGTHAVLAVSDEGIGIAEEDRQRIFEPFKRSKSPRADIPGVGLGLSVARQLVRAHGGDIEVESRLGAGSTFTVRLPLPARE